MQDLLLSDEETQAVQEGADAQALLDSPAFLSAIEAVRRDCAESILISPPHATQEREAAYQLSRGLSAVTQRLADLATRGETILDLVTAPADIEPDDSPFDDAPDY